MNGTATARVAGGEGRLYVELASSQADVVESQRLRYRIFGEEMGATVKGARHGLDRDDFDPYCQHLLVRESIGGRLVASTRILADTQARRLGRWYSGEEFDLGGIPLLPGRLLEIGRTCVHPDYRQGAAIAVLWSGLAGFINMHGFDYLFGCASLPLGEGGGLAEAIMNRLRREAMAPAHLRVVPRLAVPRPGGADNNLAAPMPPLLRAYVRLGAKACGEPFWDRDFNVADVLMLLNVDDLTPNYSRHFLARTAVV
jgi:putative hemolysin